MPITIDEGRRLFTITTDHATYQLGVHPLGFLMHYYYGPRTDGTDFSYLPQYRDRGLSPQPADAHDDRTVSCDAMPLEYPCQGSGDFRTVCLRVRRPVEGQDAWGCDLRYAGHRLLDQAPCPDGLPVMARPARSGRMLQITLRDQEAGVEAVLYYTAYESCDVIARQAVIRNIGADGLTVVKAASAGLDLYQPQPWDALTLYGRWAGERNVQRQRLGHGTFAIGSTRGASSAQHNPFIAVCDPDAGEDHGCCYGLLLAYSGGFAAQAQLDQFDQTRLTMGMADEGLALNLAHDGCLATPQVMMVFAADGLGAMSRRLHDAIRGYLLPPAPALRPVLLNSWEACYFDIDEKRILTLARQAADLGMDMLVMDDGWFGHRDDDRSSLGDWTADRRKFPDGLSGLAAKVRALGLKFGLWLEPEMVSMDSDLYRAHPDWVLAIPGRVPHSARDQYVLDMTNGAVTAYLWDRLSRLLAQGGIDYVKWDMNRNITEAWSHAPGRHGALMHDYIKAVYALLQRLTAAFPAVLFEGCAAGGGRFDAGMMACVPQIWCSDDTDPIERLAIQYGTSLAYPACAMTCHVSVSPNHQTGRSTPLATRGIVAMAGVLGYELDPAVLSAGQKEAIRAQVARYKDIAPLMMTGDLYRLTPGPDKTELVGWMFVAKDRRRAVVSAVATAVHANAPAAYLRLAGLDPAALYAVEGRDRPLSGQALMAGGLPLGEVRGDYPAWQLVLTAV